MRRDGKFGRIDEHDILVGVTHGDLVHPGGIKVRRGELPAVDAAVRADKALAEIQPRQRLIGQIAAEILAVRAVFAADERHGHIGREQLQIGQRIGIELDVQPLPLDAAHELGAEALRRRAGVAEDHVAVFQQLAGLARDRRLFLDIRFCSILKGVARHSAAGALDAAVGADGDALLLHFRKNAANGRLRDVQDLHGLGQRQLLHDRQPRHQLLLLFQFQSGHLRNRRVSSTYMRSSRCSTVFVMRYSSRVCILPPQGPQPSSVATP